MRPWNRSGVGGVAHFWTQVWVVSDTRYTQHRGRAMTTAEQTGTQAEAGEATHGVNLTDAAAAKAKALLEQEGRDDMHLRIAVQPGGCAGLRYQLFFDERTLDGDLFRDFNGLRVAVDRMS